MQWHFGLMCSTKLAWQMLDTDGLHRAIDKGKEKTRRMKKTKQCQSYSSKYAQSVRHDAAFTSGIGT